MYHVAWIACDAAHLDGLRKGLCQNAVNIAHGFCVERFGLRDGDAILFDDFAVLVPFGNDAAVGEQIVVKALDDMRRELGELHRAESGFDVRCDLGLVGLDRAVFLREQIIALPDIEPLHKRQARRLYVKSVVNRFLRVAHGGQHFFLRVAADTAADRLSCAGVIADGHTGFPSTVRPCRMLPAPDAARVFAFLGIAFSSLNIFVQ